MSRCVSYGYWTSVTVGRLLGASLRAVLRRRSLRQTLRECAQGGHQLAEPREHLVGLQRHAVAARLALGDEPLQFDDGIAAAARGLLFVGAGHASPIINPS